MDVKQDEIRFWSGGWTPNGTVEVPKNYARLAAGDRFATRKAKALARQAGRPVFVEMKYVKKKGVSRAEAYWIPRALFKAVKEAAAETGERRAKERAKAKVSRGRKHEGELERLAGRLGELFPGLPVDERMEVVRHAHTGYDELLDSGWDREEARRVLHGKIRRVLDGWRKP